MSSIFVIVYEVPRAPIATLRLYQNRAVETGPLGPQVEASCHFIARHRPTTITALPALRSNIAADFSSVVQPATPLYVTAKHRPHALVTPLWLRTNIAADLSTAQPQPATNVHSLASFRAPVHALLPGLRQNPAIDVPAFTVAETNTHFVAKFAPHQLVRFRFNYNGSDFSTPQAQPATNIHFLAKFQPATYYLLPALRQNAALDVASAAETNTHFLARYSPHQITRFRHNYSGSDFSTAQPQPLTNTYVVARFQPARFFVSIGLRQNPAVDFVALPTISASLSITLQGDRIFATAHRDSYIRVPFDRNAYSSRTAPKTWLDRDGCCGEEVDE